MTLMMVTRGTRRGKHPGRIAGRVCGMTVSCAMTLAIAAGGAAPAREAEYPSGTAVATKTQDVFGILHAGTISGELYIANDFQIDQSGTVIDYGVSEDGEPVAQTVGGEEQVTGAAANTLTRVSSGLKAMPWSVHVRYSLNGPNVDSSAVSGANGLVGLHVTVAPNPLADTDYANTTIPVIAFTVPTKVTSEITGSSGTLVTQNGTDMLVVAVGRPAHTTSFDFFFTAKHCSMSPLAVAAVEASDTAEFSRSMTALATRASNLSDIAIGGGKHDTKLLNRLKAMRDAERDKAKSAIAAADPAYQQAFHDYMAAYVTSYTGHLSGSIGDSTQMSALLGTAGELNSDTPVARAVADISNATNDRSAARAHQGAADAIDDTIRQIELRGTNGLAADLKRQAASQTSRAAKDFKTGQKMMHDAMIPFSMAYTDAYTRHLSKMTGGTASGASTYAQQAIKQTNDEFASNKNLKADNQKVQAALDTMAAAKAREGQGKMLLTLAALVAKSGTGDVSGASKSAAADWKTVSANGLTAYALQSGAGVRADDKAADGAGNAAPAAPRASTRSLYGLAGRQSHGIEADMSGTVNDVVAVETAAEIIKNAVDTLAPDGASASSALKRAIDEARAAKAKVVAPVDAQSSVGALEASRIGREGTSRDVVTPVNTHTAGARFLMVTDEL
ncbi:MAG: hypothetical protein LKK47_01130 [Bifidobacterium thermacidophilum]|jgi:hypothetical protein|nr:hypothetical protein [Bifidobacterium thermacidophilum]